MHTASPGPPPPPQVFQLRKIDALRSITRLTSLAYIYIYIYITPRKYIYIYIFKKNL